MTENGKYPEEDWYEEEDPIDWARYLNILKRHWKTVVKWAGIAFVVGCMVALGTPHTYKVVSKLVPESVSNGTSGRLSSLSSLIGISPSLMSSSDAISPQIYSELVESNEFMSYIFEVPVTFTEKKDTLRVPLFEYMRHHQKKSPLGVILSLPFKIFANEEKPFIHANPLHFTKEQSLMAMAVSKFVTVDFDKKTAILNIEVMMQDPLAATDVAQYVKDYLKDYITRYRTQKSLDDCDYYEKMFSEARDEYYTAQSEYSAYSDSHQGVTLKSYMIESERLKNEASLKYQLYNATAQQLQTARAKVQQETPVFAEIIPPSVPIFPADSRKKTALAFGFVGFLMGCGYVLWKYRREEDV